MCAHYARAFILSRYYYVENGDLLAIYRRNNKKLINKNTLY